MAQEQANTIQPSNNKQDKNPATNGVVAGLKNTVGGKQDNQPVQPAVSKQDADRELMGIFSNVSILT